MKLNKIELIAFFTVAFVYFIIQAKGLAHIAPGDENVYYYMAKSITEGQLPYKDFFYAHPPLHILILSVIIKIFGVNFTLLKFATLLALLTASFFLYKTSLEFFKNNLNEENALLISILALLLFLFSFEVLFKATFSMGINFSLMFLMISFYLIFAKKYFTGGVFAGLAGLTRFYTLAPIIAIFIFIIIKKFQEKNIKDSFNMVSGFFITFGITIIALYFFFGQNFTDPVFRYHLLKPKLPNQKIIIYKNVLTENWIIFLAFLSSLFMQNKKKFQFFYFMIFVYFLFLLFINVIEEFYFSIAFPFMAISGSYSIVYLINKIKLKYIRYFAIIFICLIFLWNTTADVMFLEKIGFLEFSQLNQLVDIVSKSNPKLKLFGDDSIVPLLALITNRSIALNFIDSNEMRFTSGLTHFYLFTNKLDDVNLSYIILRKNKGLNQIIEFNEYISQRCKLEKEYFDVAEGSFLMYKC